MRVGKPRVKKKIENINFPVPAYILGVKAYVPGKPREALEREAGIKDSIKLASNENPLGPSPLAVEAVRQAAVKLNRYPDGGAYRLVQRLAAVHQLAPENIILGNGSDEIIGMLARALLRAGDEAILPQPSFLMYEIVVRCAGAAPVPVPLVSYRVDLASIAARVTAATRMIFLNNPHNPTGALISKTEFESFIHALPSHIVVVLDEAYIEFVRDKDCPDSRAYLNSDPLVVGLRTFSKAYGLAGLRVGYGLMAPQLADVLQRVRQPFNVNALAQAGAAAALEDKAFLNKTVRLVHDELDFMYAALDRLGLKYLKSQANFFLIAVGRNADQVFEDLLKQGVIVRAMTAYGYPEHIRVNIGLHAENVRLLAALEKVL